VPADPEVAPSSTDGILRSTWSKLRAAWVEPDQFDSITTFLGRRGLLGSARRILATVAATAGMVPLTMLVAQHRPTVGLVTAQLLGMALTVVMAFYWWKRWPTRRQSRAAVSLGAMCIALWSQAQPSAELSAQVCMATAVTGGYIAFLHSNRLLALNFALALGIDTLTTLRLTNEVDLATAIGSFWLTLFINVSVPVAIHGASRALWVYAARSTTDPLTGLLNRRAFTDALIARLHDEPGSHTHLIVLLIDLDDFKRVNDTYGHAAGDRLLTAVADALRRHVADGATVCRSGGEEFLVAYLDSAADPTPFAARLCAAVAALTPDITASIGATSAALRSSPQHRAAGYIDDLIDIADEAMYAAKRQGGNHARHQPAPQPPRLSADG
jgi:diguanylate cyclase (GGDEF)-like protein